MAQFPCFMEPRSEVLYIFLTEEALVFFMEWTMDAHDTWHRMAQWLEKPSSTFCFQPKAVLVVSALWEASSISINAAAHPHLLYAYCGFPDHTYQLQYPGAGKMHLQELHVQCSRIRFSI